MVFILFLTSFDSQKWILLPQENICDTLMDLVWLIKKIIWVFENHYFWQKSPIHLDKPDLVGSGMFISHFKMFMRFVASSKPQKWILLPKENIFDTIMALIRLIEKKIGVLENQYFCQNGPTTASRHVRQLFSFPNQKKLQEVDTWVWKFSFLESQ